LSIQADFIIAGANQDGGGGAHSKEVKSSGERREGNLKEVKRR
jgi:hypothetical protein